MNDKQLFISHWKNKLLKEGVKKFPDDFILEDDFRTIDLPGKTLLIGNQFFGSYEILTADGSQFMQAGYYHLAKYIIYANRERKEKINIPTNSETVKHTVSLYEEYINDIIKKIETDYKSNFPGDKNAAFAVNEILRMLNLVRY